MERSQYSSSNSELGLPGLFFRSGHVKRRYDLSGTDADANVSLKLDDNPRYCTSNVYLTVTREYEQQIPKTDHVSRIPDKQGSPSAGWMRISTQDFPTGTVSFPGAMNVSPGYGDHGFMNDRQRSFSSMSSITPPIISHSPNSVSVEPNVTPGSIASYYSENYLGYNAGVHIACNPDLQNGIATLTTESPLIQNMPAGSPNLPAHQEPEQAAAMLCKWEGCKYVGCFRREVDLLRHVRCVHVSPSSYQCPARGCGKFFNRKDNRDSHFRRRHTTRGQPSRC